VIIGNKKMDTVIILNINSGETLGKVNSISNVFLENLLSSSKDIFEETPKEVFYTVNLPINFKYEKVFWVMKRRHFRWGHESYRLVLCNGAKRKTISFSEKYYYEMYDVKAINGNEFLLYYLVRDGENVYHYEVALISLI
jgi:hypothetical protein